MKSAHRSAAARLSRSCRGAASRAGNGVKMPPFERVQLPNGTVLLLMERHDVPLIAFSAVVRGGAVTDPAGGSGLASLLAGLLEKGAGARDAMRSPRPSRPSAADRDRRQYREHRRQRLVPRARSEADDRVARRHAAAAAARARSSSTPCARGRSNSFAPRRNPTSRL